MSKSLTPRLVKNPPVVPKERPAPSFDDNVTFVGDQSLGVELVEEHTRRTFLLEHPEFIELQMHLDELNGLVEEAERELTHRKKLLKATPKYVFKAASQPTEGGDE